MTEEEFDSLLPLRPFRREDLTRAETEISRCTTMGMALWGRTAGDLQRKLDAVHPEIPPGCDLADLHSLQRYVQQISAALNDTRNGWLSSLALSLRSVLIGTRQITMWEARSEILRRAIEYLEKR